MYTCKDNLIPLLYSGKIKNKKIIKKNKKGRQFKKKKRREEAYLFIQQTLTVWLSRDRCWSRCY